MQPNNAMQQGYNNGYNGNYNNANYNNANYNNGYNNSSPMDPRMSIGSRPQAMDPRTSLGSFNGMPMDPRVQAVRLTSTHPLLRERNQKRRERRERRWFLKRVHGQAVGFVPATPRCLAWRHDNHPRSGGSCSLERAVGFGNFCFIHGWNSVTVIQVKTRLPHSQFDLICTRDERMCPC